MSLCLFVRMSDGGIMMAADTAISTQIDGVTYRVQDLKDDEKIIEHNGALVFCSGSMDKCQKIRRFIRSMPTLNLIKVQDYAQSLFRHNTDDDSTGILVCWPDGSLVGMLSAQDFQIVPIPREKSMFFALGAEAEKDAYAIMNEYTESAHDQKTGLALFAYVYARLQNEMVGGCLHVFFRDSHSEQWSHISGSLEERPGIRKVKAADAIASRPKCRNGIVKAKDFYLPSGDSFIQALNDRGQIKGDFIDAKGMRIVDDAGETVLNIDKTGIHWSAKYSPVRYQYAASASGPWNDTQSPSDEYRRESFDGGVTWSNGIKFVARDGAPGSNGSDASVTYSNIRKALQKASGTTTAYLTMNEAGAPEIFGGKIYGGEFHGGKFNVYFDEAEPVTSQGGFNLFGEFNGVPYHFLQIRYDGSDTPIVSLTSPDGASLEIGKSGSGAKSVTKFRGTVNFDSANVEGIVARFA